MRAGDLARLAWIAAAVLAAAGAGPARAGGVESVTIFDCGHIVADDKSRWSPGVDVGVKNEMAASCYLIRHTDGLMMWDFGIADSVADMADGLAVANGTIVLTVTKTLAAQMAEIGVAPEDVGVIAMSHTHPDHTGNANRFTEAVWYIQQAEYDAAFGADAGKFNFRPATYDKAGKRIVKLDGEMDVFGDGSVRIIPAPGHTPGHQVLLVMLPDYGPVVISGDLWHFRSNYEHDRVPSFNYDRDLTLASMAKIKALMAETGARLWIQHDREQNAELPHAPLSIR